VSLSREQVQFIARHELFASAIRDALTAIARFHSQFVMAERRHRARVVTRNKQRRTW
jgi:hypothetical protein